jgi:hypothetical protein
MKQLSISQYAKTIGLTRQAVLFQINQNRLPENVSAIKIGKFYVISIQEKSLD